jgi:rSAM/selenodomain-associated transferase 1
MPPTSLDALPHVTVAIMAKAPVPGQTKTRLIPLLGATGAAQLQRWLIERSVATAVAADLGPVMLWCAGPLDHPDFQQTLASGSVSLHPQPDGDIGDRMLASAEAAKSPAGVLIIGTDCPALTPTLLRQAAAALTGHDAVVFPAEDGGYVLIGMRRPVSELFAGIEWSTERVMAQTRERLVSLGWSWSEPATLWDVDRQGDYERLISAIDMGWVQNRSGIGAETFCNEYDLIVAELPLEGARILEIGCGKAEKTRLIAQSGTVSSIVALEVDEIQHGLNLQIADLPNVEFRYGAAEAIPTEDASFDIVMIFKSLHHVPIAKMALALREIHRVLKPGGLAWISEPVYDGEFNEIMRLFHDEKDVLNSAFLAIRQAVDDGLFQLVRQRFFSTPRHFDSFEQFEERNIRVTHTNHRLSAELLAAVRRKFETQLTDTGATFRIPLRVDTLRKE